MAGLLEKAKQLASLAEEEALARGVPITLSVVDVHGNIVLKHRMEGSLLISVEMSELKAYTAVSLRMPTNEIMPLTQPGGPFYSMTSVGGGRFVAFGGGYPLRSGDAVVAAVGVSGGTTEQDMEIAEAALRRAGPY